MLSLVGSEMCIRDSICTQSCWDAGERSKMEGKAEGKGFIQSQKMTV
jgi:hypothetical protein